MNPLQMLTEMILSHKPTARSWTSSKSAEEASVPDMNSLMALKLCKSTVPASRATAIILGENERTDID